MTLKRTICVALSAIVSAMLLGACGTNGGNVENNLTWQDAKSDAQTTELEIASLIPKEQVASIDQRAEGTLLSCDAERHQWAGGTALVLVDGTDAATIVTVLADAFRDSEEFAIEEYTDMRERRNFQLITHDGEESYIVGPSVDPGVIDISSGSACFTLPRVFTQAASSDRWIPARSIV
ncbi:hypothetical protein [Agromyces laixinhei]|uniref:hypothetical protein n=1 Tax=Agromyces laixinhei TaxID=2585717 RepID=UPI0012EDE4EA|nr:hypothetical protein [Agromyces laixinhei]